jgi:hypothetical protein
MTMAQDDMGSAYAEPLTFGPSGRAVHIDKLRMTVLRMTVRKV